MEREINLGGGKLYVPNKFLTRFNRTPAVCVYTHMHNQINGPNWCGTHWAPGPGNGLGLTWSMGDRHLPLSEHMHWHVHVNVYYMCMYMYMYRDHQAGQWVTQWVTDVFICGKFFQLCFCGEAGTCMHTVKIKLLLRKGIIHVYMCMCLWKALN